MAADKNNTERRTRILTFLKENARINITLYDGVSPMNIAILFSILLSVGPASALSQESFDAKVSRIAAAAPAEKTIAQPTAQPTTKPLDRLGMRKAFV